MQEDGGLCSECGIVFFFLLVDMVVILLSLLVVVLLFWMEQGNRLEEEGLDLALPGVYIIKHDW